MIPGWILLLVSAGYVGVLFVVAYYGDQRETTPKAPWMRPVVYSLALAVYCSSWTFYGAVGTAARTGLGFLPIYLGPLLMLAFGWRILERLVLISGQNRIVSIADFLSSRYGRAPGLAALVAAVALTAAVPYVALQFKAVAMSVEVLANVPSDAGLLQDPAFYVALLLAVFAILFGTRQIDATEHHRGMVLAVALESLVKLLAFLAIGLFALFHLPGTGALPERMIQAASIVTSPGVPSGFVAQTLLAFAAIVCLPRQFHVAVVECQDPSDLRSARWLFGGYLVLISLLVVPITLTGQALLAGTGASPDTYVLALPLALQQESLALIVYIGGFSAATGMVIVASVALSTMVSNDLIMPLLLRSGALHENQGIDKQVLWVRRITILGLAMMAYAYHRGSAYYGRAGDDTLAQHGLLAFAAVAQFAPALIGGLYWRGASRSGAFAGLFAGTVLWLYTLLLPALAHGGWFGSGWIEHGPLGVDWLQPEQLFGLHGWDPLTHGTFWSLLFNVGVFLFVSVRQRPRLQEQLLASPYLDPYVQRPALGPGGWAGSVRGGELLALAERIVGERHARRAFEEYAQQQGRGWQPEQPADRALAQFTERLLASAIGAASARLTLTTALRGSGMELGEVVALLDEANQELRFNRQILSTTLENISQGVSVVDAEMRLVAWNRRYQELFDYPDGMLYVGRPVSDLIRWNAERGEMGPGGIEEQVQRRLSHLRAGAPHVFERVRANGQVIEMRGRPLPGGYVTTYSDVTDYKRAEQGLREVNETLEQRVELRTREAEAAQQSKTRFLAAISHDVLQPLNAARLFASALRESPDTAEQARLAERVDASLRAAEDLLDGLLDISRLDAGALRIEITDFDVNELLRELVAQYAPVAAGRGLQVRIRAPERPRPVRSDRRLLRRALQNFLANALRYTREGGVLIAARVRDGAVELQVWDTGPGISEHHLAQIFDEFRRFDHPGVIGGERGLGLGLSICQRIARTLEHPLRVRSRVGIGSVFSITVPFGRAMHAAALPEPHLVVGGDSLAGLRVLCVDNDREILDGMRSLLQRWGVTALTAANADEALALLPECPDVALVDYHLHDRLDGLGVIDELRAQCGRNLPAALLTGDGSDALKLAAREHGCRVLTKPVKPASLRAFLAAQRQTVQV